MTVSPPLWKQRLKESFSRIDSLADFLELDQEKRCRLPKKSSFPLLLPRRLAEKIEKNNLDDPIFRQFIPLLDEEVSYAGFQKDPLHEASFSSFPKLLSKYAARVLLLPSGHCAMNCRYCFRRHFPYAPHSTPLEKELTAIHQDPSIQEVILSGGDPLSLSDPELQELLRSIDAIPHITKIRFHTRFPIGIPERITPLLLETIQELRCQCFFVIHCNHAHELDGDVLHALKQVQQTGTPVLSQSVLLHKVNDEVETLIALFTALTDGGIIPYYLHQLDEVEGAGHFATPTEQGLKLIEACRERLPGYAIPNFVKEFPGKGSKTPLHTLYNPQT